jgi:hypothetical protein
MFLFQIPYLQAHFQCRLWNCKFLHHNNKTIAKTFPMQAMALQVSSSWQQDHCKNPQYDYFHVHRLWHCKFANYLRTVLDVLEMQQKWATWPSVRLGNWYRISKLPPQRKLLEFLRFLYKILSRIIRSSLFNCHTNDTNSLLETISLGQICTFSFPFFFLYLFFSFSG